MKKIILLLCSAVTFQISIGQKQRIGLDLTIGQTYYHITQSQSIIKQEINGEINNIDATISGMTSFKVMEIKDSVYEMSVSYQQLAMSMKMSTGEIAFSSEKNDPTDILSSILSTMKDKPFLMTMTKTGKIIEVKNIDSVFAGLFDKVPQMLPSQQQQIREKLKQSFGERAFKGSFEMVTAIYPDVPVEIGNTWITRTKLESGMEANLSTTFVFKEKGNSYNLITGIGKIETIKSDSYFETDGMQIQYNLTGNFNCSIKLDNKTGWLIESKTHQSISGTALIKDNPQLPGGLTIPMTIETEMTYSSK